MSKRKFSRREFVRQNSLAGLGAAFAMGASPAIFANSSVDPSTPAIIGGNRVRTKGWSRWPIWNTKTDEEKSICDFRV